MGRSSRPRPILLADKLLRIRQALGISQEEMLKRLGDIEGITRSSISGYELGSREPPLQVLLEYARVANVYLEVLADDRLDLPDCVPCSRKHEGIESKFGRIKRQETSLKRKKKR